MTANSVAMRFMYLKVSGAEAHVILEELQEVCDFCVEFASEAMMLPRHNNRNDFFRCELLSYPLALVCFQLGDGMTSRGQELRKACDR